VLDHIADINAIKGAWMPIRIQITKQQSAPYTLEYTDRA
jgi:hypothetical protein